jgi:hypothetical protein
MQLLPMLTTAQLSQGLAALPGLAPPSPGAWKAAADALHARLVLSPPPIFGGHGLFSFGQLASARWLLWHHLFQGRAPQGGGGEREAQWRDLWAGLHADLEARLPGAESRELLLLLLSPVPYAWPSPTGGGDGGGSGDVGRPVPPALAARLQQLLLERPPFWTGFRERVSMADLAELAAWCNALPTTNAGGGKGGSGSMAGGSGSKAGSGRGGGGRGRGGRGGGGGSQSGGNQAPAPRTIARNRLTAVCTIPVVLEVAAASVAAWRPGDWQALAELVGQLTAWRTQPTPLLQALRQVRGCAPPSAVQLAALVPWGGGCAGDGGKQGGVVVVGGGGI